MTKQFGRNVSRWVFILFFAAGWQVRQVDSITFSRTGGKKYFSKNVFKRIYKKSFKKHRFLVAAPAASHFLSIMFKHRKQVICDA